MIKFYINLSVFKSASRHSPVKRENNFLPPKLKNRYDYEATFVRSFTFWEVELFNIGFVLRNSIFFYTGQHSNDTGRISIQHKLKRVVAMATTLVAGATAGRFYQLYTISSYVYQGL